MVADNCLLTTRSTLLASLQWDSSRLDIALRNLEQRHYLYTRRSDGVICLMRSTTENVRRDIEQETARCGRIDIADQLTELRDPGFTIPRRYNDRFEMVRFFRNVYVSPERFIQQRNADFLVEKGFADGYVVYLWVFSRQKIFSVSCKDGTIPE